jgi:hypothetical protein
VFFTVLAPLLAPLSNGTIRTKRCSGAALTTGAAWACDESPADTCPVATESLGCASAGLSLSWAEALARNPRSITITEQKNARFREPNSAGMERPETGAGDKGLSTNTPYNFSLLTGHNSRGQVMKFTKQSSCSSMEINRIRRLKCGPNHSINDP